MDIKIMNVPIGLMGEKVLSKPIGVTLLAGKLREWIPNMRQLNTFYVGYAPKEESKVVELLNVWGASALLDSIKATKQDFFCLLIETPLSVEFEGVTYQVAIFIFKRDGQVRLLVTAIHWSEFYKWILSMKNDPEFAMPFAISRDMEEGELQRECLNKIILPSMLEKLK